MRAFVSPGQPSPVKPSPVKPSSARPSPVPQASAPVRPSPGQPSPAFLPFDAQAFVLAHRRHVPVFLIIGEKKPTAFFHADGTYDVRDALELSLTVDERIADGLYFANSIKLLRTLLANPELLELPIQAPVEFSEASAREAVKIMK